MKKTAPLLKEAEVKIEEGFVKNSVFWIVIVIILLVLAALPSLYFYNQYQKTKNLLQNPTASVNDENKTLIQAVGKLIELPVSENPTIATVSDKTKLQDQPFFAHAQNGDKVLIYTQAKKAILYRPSINKIIDVAPVNIGQNQLPTNSASRSASKAAKEPVKVVLYNGTATIGLTNSAEAKIKGKISNIEVADKSNAAKKDYQNTVIIDLSGNQSQIASQLVALLGGKVVSSVPSGEAKPTADILVILGKDFVK